MTATHDRLIDLINQGRSDLHFETEAMVAWERGWNAAIDSAIRAIRVDAEYADKMRRVERLADWSESELRFAAGDR